ncbi:DNA-binding transcriptional LysR family regulator [Breznakia sp. PF5-3]|uniref:LysR family transcriptional regulator n=1 Tax=unclassified Breznakia TaxID=2623764 RepID=UPI0024060727|nr:MULTISPECIES: LysR family transcriptional regulator [unclassified Breznakia]MDF9824170.1 DNA-binding transcriptional LysR family regulator [Breznakia sp. PM6-1]MDF9834968.1 DNA-binding transcriptional LysR family regulator [Breznakia sp. PF5-3]MDF9837163.1 DNA-binding transcriptional LysR family regulator [Breznakia sp. PFB2-8]MDF9859153.1 DNA-binding transcriptional LysR family regulator [Breznakia sp. PH5-24]
MLDFRMETFLKVCEYMNFTHAAKVLNLTQPAVSQHIRYLEKEYETLLFIRDKKKLLLTPAGEILRSTLETMRNDENTLKQRMKVSLDGKKTLTFGVTMTIGEYTIVPALANFIKMHPNVDIRVRYANTQTLLSYLRHGEIDFAIVEGYFNSNDYNAQIYKSEEYIAIAAKDHMFEKPIHYLKDLVSERLLVREHGSGTRAILSKTLAIKNMSIDDFKHKVEIGNIHTIVNLLCQDCGIAFLYKSAVEEELKNGTLRKIPLSDFVVIHDFTFLWNKDSAFSTEYETIFEALKLYTK